MQPIKRSRVMREACLHLAEILRSSVMSVGGTVEARLRSGSWHDLPRSFATVPTTGPS